MSGRPGAGGPARGEPLPVDAELGALGEALERSRAAVLVAPTGSGKTTRVPPALLERRAGQVWLIEPRRIAARAAARRIAEERGARLGGEVGYALRHERVGGAQTRLWCVTEGILLARLQQDPWLEGIDALVFDEFHERRLDGDLALALARRIQREVRPDLELAVLSATLDPGPVAAFLGDAPVLESEGRRYPVEIAYLHALPGEPEPAHVARAVGAAIDVLAAGGAGDARDVLVFLAGVGEIRRTAAVLGGLVRRSGYELFELYGDLPSEAQDRVFAPGALPRIVLATNVAETSLTLPRVAAVVDSGWARVPRSQASSGLERLERVRISRASAEQRAGRAGRLGPGRCWRLWSEPEQRALAEREEPEVRRLEVTGPALQLVAFGERDPAAFDWFEAPLPAALERATGLLALLGAIEGEAGAWRVTPLGRELVRMPLHPRLARLVLAARDLGALPAGARAAALLAERDPFRRAAREAASGPMAPDDAHSDLVEAIRGLLAHESGRRVDADRGALEAVRRGAAQIERLASHPKRGPAAGAADWEEALGRAVLAAFPDRVARRREPGSSRARLVGSRGVELARGSRVREAELFVALEVTDRGADGLVERASAVEREWLETRHLRTAVDAEWDAARGRAVGVARTLYLDLPLEERSVAAPRQAAAALLARAVAKDPVRALALDRPEVRSLLARLEFLSHHCPEDDWPNPGPELLARWAEGWAREWAPDAVSLEELARLPVADLLLAQLSPEQRRALDREAPEHWTVPAGRRVQLDYPPGRPPVLAARIQELFGLSESPRLARGRVRLVVHLLAPNGRPQQVTDDLSSFWRGAYHDVAKELKRRYPRHSWPADPTVAEPTSRPKPRRPRSG